MLKSFERVFELWAELIIKCSFLVFFLALFGLGLLAYEGQKPENDIRFWQDFEAYFANSLDENFDFDLANASGWYRGVPNHFNLLVEQIDGDTILTLDAFEEILELQQTISEMISENESICVAFRPDAQSE